MQTELFGHFPSEPWTETIAPGAVVLRQFAAAQAESLIEAARHVVKQSPMQLMQTPGGYSMSVPLSACGRCGWISDEQGYRYERRQANGRPWPAMPELFSQLANNAATQAGYANFVPDSCLINHYTPGSKMSLHQDRNERDFSQPIVSVSLGVPAMFYFGGLKRSDKAYKIPLMHGDVVVWGGEARLCFHGVGVIKEAFHSLLKHSRVNLTFRKAL